MDSDEDFSSQVFKRGGKGGKSVRQSEFVKEEHLVKLEGENRNGMVKMSSIDKNTHDTGLSSSTSTGSSNHGNGSVNPWGKSHVKSTSGLQGRFAQNKHKSGNPTSSTRTHSQDVEASKDGEDGKDQGTASARRQAQYQQQRQDDVAQWVQDRERTATGGYRDINLAEQEQVEKKEQQIIPREHIPRFLRQQNVQLENTEVVSLFRDKHGDFAKMQQEGCDSLKQYRENKERSKASIDTEGYGKLREGQTHVAVAEDAVKVEKDFKTVFGGTSGIGKTDFAAIRRNLPVYTVKEKLLQVIQEHQVCIIVGETGSGKTTQQPQYLYEAGYGQFGCIVCTQPRRVAAVSVAMRVQEEFWGCRVEEYKHKKQFGGSNHTVNSGTLDTDIRETDVGGTVGYTIRFEDVTSPYTKIKYMTDGILQRELMSNNSIPLYSVVVLDEAHERSINTDTLLGMLRRVCALRPDLKVVVTSATMDAGLFSDFFGGAPIFTIPGRTFPVEIVWAKAAKSDYVLHVVDTVARIHQSGEEGDILCFLTGQEDIEAVCSLVGERLQQLLDKTPGMTAPPPIRMLPIYSSLSSEQQAAIFEDSSERKCIVASNIAETSLTVDGVRFVVDSGLAKIKVYSAKVGMDALQLAPISQANANQRAGRAGRTGPGKCFRLYTDRMYNQEMLTQPIPELQRAHLSVVVLTLMSAGVHDVLNFEFLQKPKRGVQLQAMHSLWTLGAQDDNGTLSTVGKAMAQFPLTPSLARTLVQSSVYNCVADIATVVAMASVPSPFNTPRDIQQQEAAKLAREKLQVANSDHTTLMHVYDEWVRSNRSNHWCTMNYIHPKSLLKAADVRKQQLEICKSLGVKITHSNHMDKHEQVKKALVAGYILNAAKSRGIHTYSNLLTGQELHLHPTSSVCIGVGGYVIYEEVVVTTKEYMNNVSVIDPAWLQELGASLYTTREKKKQMQGEVFLDDYIADFDSQKQKEKTEKETSTLQLAKTSASVVQIGGANASAKRKRSKWMDEIDDEE